MVDGKGWIKDLNSFHGLIGILMYKVPPIKSRPIKSRIETLERLYN